jgi:hypothetical protein
MQEARTAKPVPTVSADTVRQETVDYTEIARKMKFDYAYGKRETCTKHVDVLQKLVERSLGGRADERELVQAAADLIYKEFRLKDMTLGLWDQHDRIYRYEAMAGMQPGMWTAMKRIQYTSEQFHDPVKYNGTLLGEQTRLFLAEDEPYVEGEEDTFDRIEYLKSKRRAPDQSVEGDYLDTYIFGPGKEIVGWIEYGGTWGGKLPDIATIRWVELVAAFLGVAIAGSRISKNLPGKHP